MGSMRTLVLLVSLTACDQSGLEINVVPPDEGGVAPDRIRLFVGRQKETPELTASIAPDGAGFGEESYGNLWLRDPNNQIDVMDVTPGEQASFGFLAQSDHTELGAIVAVGYRGETITSAGALYHVKTGVGTVRVYELQLHPAVDPRQGSDAEQHVVIWGPSAGGEACVHFQNRRADRGEEHDHHNTFIVKAENDSDCDGLADDDPLECLSSTFLGTEPPQADDLACTLLEPMRQDCMLGGPSCTDGMTGAPATCTPSRFCAPDSLCGACKQVFDVTEAECLREPYSHTDITQGAIYGIKCHIPAERASGANNLCTTPIGVNVQLPATMTPLKCSNATVATAASPAHDRLEIEDMRLRVDVTDTCRFSVTPDGPMPANFDRARPINGLVTVDFDTGRSIALPIQFLFDDPALGCTNAGSCVAVGEFVDLPSAGCLSGE